VLDAGQRGGEATDASAGTPELDAGGGAPEDSGLPEGPLERDPDRSDKLVIEARRKINDGAFEEAERLLKLAQMYDSRNPRAVAGFGRLYLAKEKGEKALQHIEKAVQARNRRAGYHELLGDARTLTGDLEGALEAYRRAVQLDAHNREARRKLVETRRELEQQ
jgi:tetratricopeptide (TPR) repeat protein